MLISSPTSPFNIYIVDRQREMIEKLTSAHVGNIPEQIMVQPKLIKYNSFDGLEINAFLYRPNTTNSDIPGNHKFGAILSIHGGPTSQERPSYAYAGLYQYLLNQGLAILAPNFHGSTGYGKSFEKKIYHDWGGNELKDLEFAAKWLMSRDWIDDKRIGLFEISFGGFATLSCITRLSNYNWKAGVDIMGPSNLRTFVKSVPEHWKGFIRQLVGDAEKEEDFLKTRSPITYVDNVRLLNLLVIQGANDPRVAKDESDQIVKSLKNKGVNVVDIVFKDEGHGFTKYENMVQASMRTWYKL